MSLSAETAERFDRISDVYDETREPLSEEAIDKAGRVLSRDGVRHVLEVGIGTGRIAKPLLQRGFDVMGIDLSRRMLERARLKGLDNLMMGDANQLPFVNKSFDAVVLAHVLHLLQNPRETFEVLSSVARVELVAFVRRWDPSDGNAASAEDDGRGLLRQAFRDAAEELGYQLPQRGIDWRRRFRGETEFLASYPPGELVTVQDAEVSTTLGVRISLFEKRAFGNTSGIPDEAFQKVIEKVKSSVDLEKPVRYRRVEQMALWRAREGRFSF